ncbi:hypothetical protein L3X38_009577 [Prunus dulcis]|uniref:Uncharacterized protein n=1 Tax=Prunus dulcis TaxID=3755 RepID=A0AAD4WGK4_PRUDU|nr:hypothetical protein L3X38_009577 [Prunus dulcis]
MEMKMKKIACFVLFAAAFVSVVMARKKGKDKAAGAPKPPKAQKSSSDISAGLPTWGSLVATCLVSYLTYYLLPALNEEFFHIY